MYKIFVNNKPLYLAREVCENALPIAEIKLDTLVSNLQKNGSPPPVLYDDSQNPMDVFKRLLPVVVAGGGLVRNPQGEVLFIKRNGLWDLPKGRVEAKESIAAAALRETEEETGVKGLSIVKPLQSTYHLFNRSGRIKLKETYWFEMYTEYEGEFKPQTAEGITKVRWKDPKKTREALLNSYANVRELFVE